MPSKSSGSPGSTTNTVTQQSNPPPWIENAYKRLTNAGFAEAGQPLQQYGGPMVAGFNPMQQQAFRTIGDSQGIATPYINAAAQGFGQSMTPFYDTVQNYESPYTSSVTNSLQNLFGQQNAQQQQQVQGNAVSAGAYGGDREAVAQALTAQQQNLSEAPTMANVLQGGYQTALGADEAQGWLGQQGSFGLANLGTEAQNTALTGANAELSAGGLQQQLAQERLNIPFEQFQAQQAYPWQVLGQLSPMVEGMGSLAGGSGSTSYPGASMFSQLGGLGIAGLGTYGLGSQLGWWGGGGAGAAGFMLPGTDTALAGGFSAADLAPLVAGAKSGGRIGLQDGGIPGALPTVPAINLDYLAHPGPAVKGGGPPHAPQAPGEATGGGSEMSPTQEMQLFAGMDKLLAPTTGGGIGGGSAFGGRPGRQDGGASPLSAMESTNSSTIAGMAPMAQGFVQNMAQLPMDQLTAMVAKLPPNSAYSHLANRVLMSRRMTPSAAPNQVSSASGIPIGSGMGVVPPPPGAADQQQQQGQGPSASGGMAAGGPVISDDPDMDPHPIVDHTGDTVKIHYPSEGKTLDLGIPTISRGLKSGGRARLAAGGVSFLGGLPSLGGLVPPSGITPVGPGAPQPSPVIGSGGASPFFHADPSASGIQIPQMSENLFGPRPNTSSNAINALPQHIPGTDIGPGHYPHFTDSSPGENVLLNHFGPGHGQRGGRIGLAEGGDSPDDTGADSAAPPVFDPYSGHQDITTGRGLNAVTMMPSAVRAPSVQATRYEPPTNPADQAFRNVLALRAQRDAPPPAATAAAPVPSSAVTQPPPEPHLISGLGQPGAATVAPSEPLVAPLAPPSDTGQGIGATPAPAEAQTRPQAAVPAAPSGGIGAGGPDTIIGQPPATLPPRGASPHMTWDEAAPIVSYKESKDQNVPNYRYDPQHTAGGYFQITDTNWRAYAPRAGIDLITFPSAMSAPYGLQYQVGGMMYAENGLKPWDSAHGGPFPAGGGVGKMVGNRPISDNGDQIVGPVTGGIGGESGGIGNITGYRPQATPSNDMFRSPWLPLIAAGFGMMAGRSPQALNNVGQGGLEGVKMMQSQAEQGLRERTLENEAVNREQQRDLQQQQINQTGHYQTGELAQRQQQFQQSMKAENDRFQYEMTQANTQAEKANIFANHYAVADAANALAKSAAAAKPVPSFEVQPDGSVRYGWRAYDPTTNSYPFTEGAGVGKPPASAVQNPTVTAEKREAAYRLETQRLQTAFTAGHYGEPVPNFRPQAEANVNRTLGPPPGAPTAAAAPASAGGAGAPGWAKFHTSSLDNSQTIYSDGQGWFNADQTPYQGAASAAATP